MNISGYYYDLHFLAHDGSLALLQDNNLTLCIEGEKDSHDRHSLLSNQRYQEIIQSLDFSIEIAATQKEYLGSSPPHKITDPTSTFFLTTHERAHILCAYGMSPFPQGQPCYVLCWEGIIGKFYYIDENVNIIPYPSVKSEMVLQAPGDRYKFPFFIVPGNIMALAAYGLQENQIKWENSINKILDINIKNFSRWRFSPRNKTFISTFPLKDEESQDSKDFLRYSSQKIFEKFYTYAKENLNLTQKIPLLITGGCGLNCDWNTKWKNSGLFSDIFIPPVCNDSGIGIGIAVDAQFALTGSAKINWSPYAGEEFVFD